MNKIIDNEKPLRVGFPKVKVKMFSDCFDKEDLIKSGYSTGKTFTVTIPGSHKTMELDDVAACFLKRLSDVSSPDLNILSIFSEEQIEEIKLLEKKLKRPSDFLDGLKKEKRS